MAIEVVLAGVCAEKAAPAVKAFLELALGSPVAAASGETAEVRGKAYDVAILTCAVVQAAAAGAFLLDRASGERKVDEMLVEIRATAAPGDTMTLRVHGRPEIDLTIAKPSAVYSALKRCAAAPPARPSRTARR